MNFCFNFTEQEINDAENIIILLEDKIRFLEQKIFINNVNDILLTKSQNKIKRMKISICCIKYYYSI
jgi:hypothetical protein